jgi:hypothetical protein
LEQNDFLKKQIDLLGRILGKILSDLLKLKNNGEIQDIIEITNQALINELDLNLNEILYLDNNLIINFLQKEKKFNIDHLEKIAEILFNLGYDHDSKYRINILNKCQTIYTYLNKNSNTYSSERIMRIDKISELLK